ncbi:MAG: nucleotide exchange factor GrpE [Bacteroidales bacterium]|nr:nucleotide exchange factor GrpE [Bacteroidales bacterium]MBP5765112.1 nucleotide exchange factor GrpE [Bacteroidales bacterium]
MEKNETKNMQDEAMNNPQEAPAADETAKTEESAEAQAATGDAEKTPEDRIAELEEQLKAQKDQYLRMLADFDNYRKNQLKKTNDLLTYGGESAFTKLLPIIDDFERAVEHNAKADDVEALKEGFNLIYNKFKTYLEQNEVTVIPAAQGDAFDEHMHEAITMFPAPAPELKGKIVDCATKGYKYKDKVIRIAKVVVGE